MCKFLFLAVVLLFSQVAAFSGKCTSRVATSIPRASLRYRTNEVAMKVAVPIPVGVTDKLYAAGLALTRKTSSLSNAWKALAVFCAAVVAKLTTSVSKQVGKASNVMEVGWTKRGTGGAFSRTIEVWAFAFSFLYKYVSSSVSQSVSTRTSASIAHTVLEVQQPLTPIYPTLYDRFKSRSSRKEIKMFTRKQKVS